MKYRVIGNTNIEASVLGLGCMRLPIVDGDSTKIDYEKGTEMLHYAIDHGVNYIDTAYPYHGGNSETFLGEALKGGYREKVTLITKSPSWLHKTHEDFEKYLDEQLSKLQTEYVDIYLLHAVNKTNWENYKKIDVFSAIDKVLKSGKIKHIGFSFHDDFTLFKEVIDYYKWDLCMIQFNYMDINEQAGLKGLKYAEEKTVPVIVMEPLKGGMLASPSEDIQAIWDTYESKLTPVEWALKYVANFNNVKVVLSGMSSLEQLKQNLEIADRLLPNQMDEKALATVDKVREAYTSKVQVPCTQCRYCVPCPNGVEIPKTFTLLNRAHIYNTFETIGKEYLNNLKPEERASNCIECGECEPKCPQQIEIIKMLKQVVSTFE